MKTLFTKFCERVRITPGCWEWLGSLNNYGYGRMRHQDKFLKASHVSYELYVGPVPKGKLLRHTCDNRSCVNPDHLLPGTHADNMRDMVERGRWRQGNSKHPIKLLTLEEQSQILSSNKSNLSLSKLWGISSQRVKRIKEGASTRTLKNLIFPPDLTNQEIADLNGVSKSTILHHKPQRRKLNPLTLEEKREIGKSVAPLKALAIKYGKTESQICNIRKKFKPS